MKYWSIPALVFYFLCFFIIEHGFSQIVVEDVQIPFGKDNIKPWCCFPVWVFLKNNGPSIKMDVVVSLKDWDEKGWFRISRPVNLPKGSRKHALVYVYAYNQCRTLSVHCESDGEVLKDVRYPNNRDSYSIGLTLQNYRESLDILYLGPAYTEYISLNNLKDGFSASYQSSQRAQGYVGQSENKVHDVHVRSLPDHWFGYGVIDIIIINEAPLDELSKDQWNGIKQWLYQGGMIIIVPLTETWLSSIQTSGMLKQLIPYSRPQMSKRSSRDQMCIFNLDLRCKTALDTVNIEEIIKFFRIKGETLTKNLGIKEVKGDNSKWIIKSGKKEYSINKEGNILKVYLSLCQYFETQSLSEPVKIIKVDADNEGKVKDKEIPEIEGIFRMHSIGKGRVFYLGVDIIHLDTLFWKEKIIPNMPLFPLYPHFKKSYGNYYTRRDSGLCDSLNIFQMPTVFVIIILMIVYLVTVGPLNFFYLSRKKKLEYILLSIPLISIIYIGVVLGYGYVSKGVNTRLTSITFAYPLDKTGASFYRSYIGLLSSSREVFNLGYGREDYIMPLYHNGNTEESSYLNYNYNSKNGGFLLDYYLNLWQMGYFTVEGFNDVSIPYPKVERTRYTYTIENRTGSLLKEATILDNRGSVYFGDISAGAKVQKKRSYLDEDFNLKKLPGDMQVGPVDMVSKQFGPDEENIIKILSVIDKEIFSRPVLLALLENDPLDIPKGIRQGLKVKENLRFWVFDLSEQLK